jgi:hypothetical protein
MDTKEQLTLLIENSRTLKSLPGTEKESRKTAMLNADEATMKNFIQILEREAQKIEKVDSSFQKEFNEIEGLITEAKQLENNLKRDMRKDAEVNERTESESKAEDILKELDNIA